MIGLVTLGHSPRPDHAEVYDRLCPEIPTLLEGALDSLSCDEARGLEDKSGISPLVCLLSDRTTVEIPLPVLAGYIEQAINRLAENGASLAVVLCCGGFPAFTASIPVLLPGKIVPAMVGSAYGQKKVGIVVPNAAQQSAAVAHWQSAGIDVVASAVVSPYQGTGFEEAGQIFKGAGCEVIAIDCMGFTEAHRERLAKECGCTVLLPKTLVARVAAEISESAR